MPISCSLLITKSTIENAKHFKMLVSYICLYKQKCLQWVHVVNIFLSHWHVNINTAKYIFKNLSVQHQKEL